MIWPEFTVPLCWSCDEPLYREFAAGVDKLVASGRATLVLGTNEVTGPKDDPRYHNTAMAIHPDLSRSLYFKVHLVPFGRVLSSSRLLTPAVLTETIYPRARLSTPGSATPSPSPA